MWMVLLQPARSFRLFSAVPDARQWVWMALIILILTGVSAARGGSVAQETANPVELAPSDSGAVPSDPFGGGPPADFSGVPQDGQAASSGSDVSESWTTALIASSNIVLAWLLLVVLLCEVSLARGKRPRLAHNVQIAVWASVPLGLMAVLQIVYYAAGGQAGEPGLAGLLPEWGRYADLSRGQRSLLLSGATRATLFGLWTVVLVYMGARQTLKGHWWTALMAVLLWAALIVAIPVVAGTIKAPEDEVALPAEFVPGTGEGDVIAPDYSGEGGVISPDKPGAKPQEAAPAPAPVESGKPGRKG